MTILSNSLAPKTQVSSANLPNSACKKAKIHLVRSLALRLTRSWKRGFPCLAWAFLNLTLTYKVCNMRFRILWNTTPRQTSLHKVQKLEICKNHRRFRTCTKKWPNCAKVKIQTNSQIPLTRSSSMTISTRMFKELAIFQMVKSLLSIETTMARMMIP